jgi:hypothetical protein
MASHPAQPIANTYASKTASPPPQAQTSLHMVQSNVIPKYPSAETVLAGPSVSNQVDDFQIPKYHKKRQQKTVLGKKTGDTRLKVGPEPSREVFVYRVDKSTNIEDMRDFVVNEGFTVRDIKTMSHEDSLMKSFKITIPVSQLHKIMDPEMWPEGIRVRKFIAPKAKTQTNLNGL